MIWLVVVMLALVLGFASVVLVGAPYLPTLKPQIQAALELIDLKPGQTLLELGCGDGRLVVAAARAGLKVTAYELNPWLVAVAWLRTRRYRQNVKIRWGDFWHANWPAADGIFVFLLPKYMKKLDKKIMQTKTPTKLVSFAFTIPDKQPVTEKAGVFLYLYH